MLIMIIIIYEKKRKGIDVRLIQAKSNLIKFTYWILFGLCSIVIVSSYSITVGAATIPISAIQDAIFHYDSSNAQHVVIWDLRLPRVFAAILVGASFAVAGAIMQGVTRNSLADPGILGINAGAAFALAISFVFFPNISFTLLMFITFIGAVISMGLTFGVTSLYGQVTALRLVLAGSAVSALFFALSEAVTIYFKVSQDVAFWYAGGLIGVSFEQLKVVAPWIVAMLMFAILFSRKVTTLSLGEDVAIGLGEDVRKSKFMLALVVLLLAGASVSMVGPIGFIGLVVPHMVRGIVGVDYRYIIPCSAIYGALLLLISDLLARTINPPYEIPVGAILALIGVPFFLHIARKARREL
ncbi:iron ABC transporter permease [Exiguobacterium sp. SH5S4]|uniref:FecCD family ABC transporter permease n=1 Tax=Exiguobacterium sp. SH5S4 TaxID=2510961 RepID=UPI00103AF0DE|nr:iron ABC transporter permease [Exiguobacterium sp. SH5S4]TCI25937.1 iron ABC transporter permease [Exiguobacterium sp. SH5S4]